ncbi:hypothetical protein FRB98_007824 [Tulasnella sp. 332]|nr:hypothetical protein FRB98_007824 [Tulasnella sp. 332]
MQASTQDAITALGADIVRDRIMCYGNISAVMMVVYDWVTTADDEIDYIWTRGSGLSGRPLYCFIRYAGLGYQIYNLIATLGTWTSMKVSKFTSTELSGLTRIPIQFCRVYYDLLPLGTLVFLYAADVLLAYRVLCIYRMNQVLLIFNCCIFAASVITSVALASFTVSSLGLVSSTPHLTGCWTGDASAYSFFTPLPGLLFETWIFGLVLLKIINYSRNQGWKWVREGGILGLIVRDFMWWFVVISFMIALNIVLLATLPYSFSSVGLSCVIVFGCRLIIHMRKAAQQSKDGEERPLTQEAMLGGRRPHSMTSSIRAEELRIGKALSLAQRVGLPPPLAQDLVGMWYQPVATLNTGTAAYAIELDVVSVDSPINADIVAKRPEILQVVTEGYAAQIGRPPDSSEVSPISPQGWRSSEQQGGVGITPVRWDELEQVA